MGRTVLPDILTIYPPGSLAIWRKAKIFPSQKHYEMRYSYVLARVTGKVERQGNKRLSLDVCYIGSNVTGQNVLYRRHMSSVSVENIMTVEAYRRQMATEKGG